MPDHLDPITIGPETVRERLPLPAHRERPVRLAWADRVLTSTGPSTYRLVVSIVGPAPGPHAITTLIRAIQDVCLPARPSPDGTVVRSVRGHVRSVSDLHSSLCVYITTSQPGPAGDLDGAYVAALVRAAARAIGPSW